jgi:glycogen synthase
MKICVVQSWGFQSLDGSNLRVYFLLKELVKRGHDVTIINASKADAEYSRKLFGCKAEAAGVNISRWDSSFKKLFSYSLFILLAGRVARKIECDLIFGISFLNSMVAIQHPRAKKCAMYVDLMSNYYRYEAGSGIVGLALYNLGKYLEDLTMSKSDSIITITNALKALLDKKHWPKTFIIPDGVDTEVFNPFIDIKDFRAELKLSDKKVVGYFGAVDPCDGVQYLAEVAPQVIKAYPETVFLIVGRGNYLEKVKETLARNGTLDHFVFTGWVKNTQVPYYIKSSDICVIPNVKDKSIAPLITYRLLEGMAMGANIIASDLEGIREIADDNAITFTDPENTDKFARDIIKIFEMPEDKKASMKNRCWEIVKELDWRKIAIMDSDLIEKTL